MAARKGRREKRERGRPEEAEEAEGGRVEKVGGGSGENQNSLPSSLPDGYSGLFQPPLHRTAVRYHAPLCTAKKKKKNVKLDTHKDSRVSHSE